MEVIFFLTNSILYHYFEGKIFNLHKKSVIKYEQLDFEVSVVSALSCFSFIKKHCFLKCHEQINAKNQLRHRLRVIVFCKNEIEYSLYLIDYTLGL